MGAQWKHAGRQQNSAKRGALIGKLVKEIIVAAKIGDPHPDNNPRLRAALEVAKKASVPRDTLDRAIKKGAGLLDEQVNYELVTYEGFAPHRVPVIIECLTENKNRTAADMRVLFRGAQLGSVGSVSWMFDRLGVVEATHNDAQMDYEGAAIEANAQNVEKLEASEVAPGQTGARFFCDPKDLDSCSKYLIRVGWTVTTSELSYLIKAPIALPSADRKEVEEFLTSIDDHDDVHRIYTAIS